MLETPQLIGRYQVVRLLGAGAMGAVYLAEDPLLKRRVAIKVIRAIGGGEREVALDRFRREAEISAQLNHPNVVMVYDVGEQPGYGPFLAMEFVEGQGLGGLIRQGGTDPEQGFRILIQAMRALRAAHRHAIVHRDVKPDNILVGEDGRVKLMDFGIARTMAPRLTSQGEFLGSPAYSAPEMLRGEDPTPSSDRYAFAVTAFELLSGHLPHPGASVAAVIAHILQEPIVIPMAMPARVGYVFQRALAPDPDDRYETLPEFMMDLLDAYPLEAAAKARIQDLFRHDDFAGDIVPARLLKPKAIPESTPAAARSSASRPAPVLTTQPMVKIELEPQNSMTEASRSSARQSQNQQPLRPKYPEPFTIVKWIFFVVVAGQMFWWIYGLLKY